MRPEIRIAAFYARTFGVFGVSLPYWPLWLQARGLSADQIGLVFAASMLGKIVAIPMVAALADRLDRRRAVILCLLLASLAPRASICRHTAPGRSSRSPSSPPPASRR
jgi:PPP family 3-phenylpropionic acid transporter